MSFAVSAKNIYKEYPGDRKAVLSGLSIELEAGSSLAVVGSSGCGKTSLLNILGLLDPPTSGMLSLLGTCIYPDNSGDSGLISKFRNTNIGYIFQSHNLLSDFSVLENILLPASLYGAATSEHKRRALAYLSMLDLLEYKDSSIAVLSGGQMQRVSVIRALIHAPSIILADEPTGNLDSENSKNIISTLLNFSKDASVIIVTHDESVARMCDAVLDLKDGALC